MAFGAPLWLAFVLTCVVAMLVLGVGFKRVIVDPLIRHGVIPLVIATIGLSIGLKRRQGRLQRAGASLPQPFPAGQFSLGGSRLLRRHRHAGPRGRDRLRPADVPE